MKSKQFFLSFLFIYIAFFSFAKEIKTETGFTESGEPCTVILYENEEVIKQEVYGYAPFFNRIIDYYALTDAAGRVKAVSHVCWINENQLVLNKKTVYFKADNPKNIATEVFDNLGGGLGCKTICYNEKENQLQYEYIYSYGETPDNFFMSRSVFKDNELSLKEVIKRFENKKLVMTEERYENGPDNVVYVANHFDCGGKYSFDSKNPKASVVEYKSRKDGLLAKYTLHANDGTIKVIREYNPEKTETGNTKLSQVFDNNMNILSEELTYEDNLLDGKYYLVHREFAENGELKDLTMYESKNPGEKK